MPWLRFHISVELTKWIAGTGRGSLDLFPHSCLHGPVPLFVLALALI